MTFAEDALVYISACSSQGYGRDFRQACWRKGAGTYIGWTGEPNGRDTSAAAAFFFDRMLGQNEHWRLLYPGGEYPLLPVADPPLRPFGLVETLGAMAVHQKPWDGRFYDFSWPPHEIGAPRLWASGRQEEDPEHPGDWVPAEHTTGALRPPIYRLKIDEAADQLTIEGEPGFGSLGTRVGRVTLEGNNLQVVTWDPQRIVCDLPRTAAGEVKVLVNEVPSNSRWISVWRDVDLSFILPPQAICCSIAATWHFPEIRADIMSSRSKEFLPPTDWSPLYPKPSQNAQFSWDVSGTCPDGEFGTNVYTKGPDPGPVYNPSGYLDSGGKSSEFSCEVTLTASQFTFRCGAYMREGMHVTHTDRFGVVSEREDPLILPFTMQAWQIPANGFQVSVKSGETTAFDIPAILRWSVGSSNYLPDSETAR